MIPQQFSWGQLSITQEACEDILLRHHVFTSFLDVIHSFGCKLKAGDDVLKRRSHHGYVSNSEKDAETKLLYGTDQYVQT